MRNQDAKIFFTLGQGALMNEFWGEAAQRRAKQLGFTVGLNPTSGPQSPEFWAEQFADLDALITTWGAPKLDEKVLGRNTTLKIVGHAAGSVAGVASPYLYERGIRLVNANAIMARTVAEWCLMTTLIGWSRFLDYTGIGRLSAMNWADRGLVRGMQDATIAIWGYGQISSHLIEILKPYGPKEILVYSGHLKSEEAEKIGITLVDFDEMFTRGDVIHLLGALTEKNLGKVGAKQLAAIRDGSVLVNAGRAALIDEAALLAELPKGRFRAILDVFYKEPLADDSPLRGLSNVVLTPHLAGRGREGEYVPHVLEEFDRFFRGEPLVSEVAPDRAAMMTDSTFMSGKKKEKA